jgi:uncharacterized membrane protein
MRFIVFSVSIITVVLGTAVVGLFPNGWVKRWMNEKLMLVQISVLYRFNLQIYSHSFRFACGLPRAPSPRSSIFMMQKTGQKVEVCFQ